MALVGCHVRLVCARLSGWTSRSSSTSFGTRITAMSAAVPPLVTAEWLMGRLASLDMDNGVRVIEATSDGGAGHRLRHIPSAVCFDVPTMTDKTSAYKNMLPKPEHFADYVSRECGVTNDHHVVIYDAHADHPSLLLAARAWLMFRVFGHDRVSVLDGGLHRWTDVHKYQTSDTPAPKPEVGAPYTPRYRRELVWTFEQTLENIGKDAEYRHQLVDARGPNVYSGAQPQPNCDNVGHIRTAVNTHSAKFIDPATRCWKSPEQLAATLEELGIDVRRPLVTSCGTGMSACSVALAAHIVAGEDALVPLYDGSFFEFEKRAPKDMIVSGPNPI